MNHMAQLRHDYSKFQALETEVVVVVPNGPKTIHKFLGRQDYPYPILSDKGSLVATEVFHIRKMLSLVLPTVFVLDRSGHIRYCCFGKSPMEEPCNAEPLAVLEEMQVKKGCIWTPALPVQARALRLLHRDLVRSETHPLLLRAATRAAPTLNICYENELVLSAIHGVGG